MVSCLLCCKTIELCGVSEDHTTLADSLYISISYIHVKTERCMEITLTYVQSSHCATLPTLVNGATCTSRHMIMIPGSSSFLVYVEKIRRLGMRPLATKSGKVVLYPSIHLKCHHSDWPKVAISVKEFKRLQQAMQGISFDL